MSFPRAKVIRFNENSGCTPGVGYYDTKIDPRIPGAVFERTQRFKELLKDTASSSSITSISSRGSTHSSTSSIMVSRSAKKGSTSSISTTPLDVSESFTSNVFLDSPTKDPLELKESYHLLNAQLEKQKDLIKWLQNENRVLKEKLISLQSANLTPKRESLSSPPTCCSSPLLKFVGLSPIAKPRFQERDELKSSQVKSKHLIHQLQTALKEAKAECDSLSFMLKEKPVAIIVNGSPEMSKPKKLSQLSPENREFVVAKHSALVKLSEAEDEIYKLKDDLKDFETFKSKLNSLEKEDEFKSKKIDELKTQVVKSDIEVKEMKVSFKTLQDTFQGKFYSQQSELTNLNKIVTELNIQLDSKQKEIDLQSEKENKLTKKFISLKEQTNDIKVEYEDAVHKANEEIELLTAELEHIRIILQEKTELEDELKLQIQEIKKDAEENLENKVLEIRNNYLQMENEYTELKREKSSLEDDLLKLKTQLHDTKLSMQNENENLLQGIQLLKDEKSQIELEKSSLDELLLKKESLLSNFEKENVVLQQRVNEYDNMQVENQILKGQLESQIEESAKQNNAYEEREKDIWNRLIKKKNEIKDKDLEIQQLKQELHNLDNEKWKTLYEELLVKVEPFKEQLDAYAHEKSLLVHETDNAMKQLGTLEKKYAKLMGHSNHKQKIQYLCKLQNEISDLRQENVKLKDANYKQHLLIQKYQPEPDKSSKSKTKAKNSAQPLKENMQKDVAYF